MGSTGGGSVGFLMYQSMLALLYSGKTVTSRRVGVECVQPSMEVSSELCFPPPALIPIEMSKFLAEHVRSQFRVSILVAPCWKEVPWLAVVHNMLENIFHQCPIVKDLIMDVLVGLLLKGLS